MKKKLNILIFLSLILLTISVYFFYQNKQTLECVSTFSFISKKIVNEKARSSLTLVLNKNLKSQLQDQYVKKNIILIDIYTNVITLISKIRFMKADPIIVKNKIRVSFNETARVFDFKILKQEINCKQESSVYNLILPTLLLLSLIIYAFIFRIKYIA
jgi:S-adenosylmethionine hydrolase